MDTDKSLNQSVGNPPSGSSSGMKSEASGSYSFPPLAPGGTSESGHFDHAMSSETTWIIPNISQMPCDPPKILGLGRAHSEILTIPDGINFESDQHIQSMDGSTTIKPEMLTSVTEAPSLAYDKKPVSATELAVLALSVPKQSKRFSQIDNTQLGSENKQKKKIAEPKRLVQSLEDERMSLIAQLTTLKMDTNSLAAENCELKMRLRTIEHSCTSKVRDMAAQNRDSMPQSETREQQQYSQDVAAKHYRFWQ